MAQTNKVVFFGSDGKVFKLSARHWMLSGPIADTMKMDDIVAMVTGQ